MNTKTDQTIPERIPEQKAVIYKCRVNIRPVYRGHQAKESILLLNGFEVTLQCDGAHFDHDVYPNEALFTPCTEQVRQIFWMYGLKYLAEGDLTILEKVEAEQMTESVLAKPIDARRRREGTRH